MQSEGYRDSNLPPLYRNDSATRCLHEQHQAVKTLSNKEVYDACAQHGIIQPIRKETSGTGGVDSLRQRLADFKAFTQFTNSKSPPLGDGLSTEGFAELLVREAEIKVHRKGTGLGENDDGTYKWVYFKDGIGAIRSMLPPDGNAM
jgi:hypothetical protein